MQAASLCFTVGPIDAGTAARIPGAERRQYEHGRLSRGGRQLPHLCLARRRRARRLCDVGQAIISPAPKGPLIETGNPLDVAVQGEGWLAIQTPGGTVYTRDGRMRMRLDGELESLAGHPILDAGGTPIILDPDRGAAGDLRRRHDHPGRAAGRRDRPVPDRSQRQVHPL